MLDEHPDVTRVLNENQLDASFDPANYSGQAQQFVDAVLDRYHRVRGV